jgi:hypothetical protein
MLCPIFHLTSGAARSNPPRRGFNSRHVTRPTHIGFFRRWNYDMATVDQWNAVPAHTCEPRQMDGRRYVQMEHYLFGHISVTYRGAAPGILRP